MTDPLLRSTPLLSALFHRGAVVCEGDVDHAFYAETQRENAPSRQPRRERHSVLSAYSWQSEQRMVRPLCSSGIPAAAIVDLDVTRKSGIERTAEGLRNAIGPRRGAGQARGQIAAVFERANANPKDGISAFPKAADCEAVRTGLPARDNHGRRLRRSQTFSDSCSQNSGS